MADSTILPDLLHGNEIRVWGDQAYRGQQDVIRDCAPKAKDFTNRRYRHCGVVDEQVKARTERGRAYGRRSNTSSVSLSARSDLPRYDIAGWRKMRIACSSPAPWPICSWFGTTCSDLKGRSVPAERRRATNSPSRPGNQLKIERFFDTRRKLTRVPVAFNTCSDVP